MPMPLPARALRAVLRCLPVVLPSLLLAVPRLTPAVVEAVPGAVSLFNGKDLSGWHVQCRPADRARSFWKVEDGAIVCDSMGRNDHDYVWLMSDEEFADFELRLQFQAYRDSPGNSGVQFRSRFDPSVDGGWLDGPQVDIHPPADMSWRTGLIYDETREENNAAHVRRGVGRVGHLALQLHSGDELRIRFRNIVLRKLDGR
jgi:hypothetical protein